MSRYFQIDYEFSPGQALERIAAQCRTSPARYVCVADGNVLVQVHRDPDYRCIVQGALFSICDMIREGKLDPEMVIGVPVGFVNVVEAKEELIRTAKHYVVARGRKGGSNVAAAIVNSVLYQLVEREG